MSSAGSSCPGEDTLAAFAVGRLEGDALPKVAQHAALCAECRLQLMAAVVGHDKTLVAHVPVAVTGGEPLNGRYVLLHKLGEGGMGVVYEAEDLVLGERVALKMLRVELASDERALGYLKSEAKLSRQISHEHVCRVYDLGSQRIGSATLHYISMELLRGPSLRCLLREGPLDHRLALRLADQVLCGLQAAHAAGVLHRDLKPDNMLLRQPGTHAPHAVITDFGLARAFQAGQRHVSASRMLVGSAAYLAPEQMDETQLTEATDLYSFGIVLFELLTGKLPFTAKTPLGVALRRLHTPAPRPSAMRPELGERYDNFVARCLARDPHDRFQSATSARVALQKLIAAAERGGRFHGPTGRATRVGLLLAGCACLWLGANALPSAADKYAGAATLFTTQSSVRAASSGVPIQRASRPPTAATDVASDTRTLEFPPGLTSASTEVVALATERVAAVHSNDACEDESQPSAHPPTKLGRNADLAVRKSTPDLRATAKQNAAKLTPLARNTTQPSLPRILTDEGFLDPFSRTAP